LIWIGTAGVPTARHWRDGGFSARIIEAETGDDAARIAARDWNCDEIWVARLPVFDQMVVQRSTLIDVTPTDVHYNPSWIAP
jgi:hypothetical protein